MGPVKTQGAVAVACSDLLADGIIIIVESIEHSPQSRLELSKCRIVHSEINAHSPVISHPSRSFRIESHLHTVSVQLKTRNVTIPRPTLATALDVNIIMTELPILLVKLRFPLKHQVTAHLIVLWRRVDVPRHNQSPCFLSDGHKGG